MTPTTERTLWHGTYYDGVSAHPHPITVHIDATGLRITAPSGDERLWHYEEIRQTHGRYAGEEVRFERGTGLCEALVVNDHSVLARIHECAPAAVTHFAHPGRRRRRLLYTIAAGLASLPLLWSMFAWGIPALARPITLLIPPSWEIEAGQAITARLVDDARRCTDPQLANALASIIAPLVEPLRNNPYAFQVHVIDDPFVNAFAAPGGQIILFRGLLETTQSAEELAAIFAHEAQHILERHTLELLIQHMSLSLLLGAIGGDIAPTMTWGLQTARLFQIYSYARDAEDEADHKGLHMLMNAGITTEGMLTFLRAIEQKEQHAPPGASAPSYLSTHPATAERIRALEAHIPSSFTPTRTVPVSADWQTVRTLCTAPDEHPGRADGASPTHS